MSISRSAASSVRVEYTRIFRTWASAACTSLVKLLARTGIRYTTALLRVWIDYIFGYAKGLAYLRRLWDKIKNKREDKDEHKLA